MSYRFVTNANKKTLVPIESSLPEDETGIFGYVELTQTHDVVSLPNGRRFEIKYWTSDGKTIHNKRESISDIPITRFADLLWCDFRENIYDDCIGHLGGIFADYGCIEDLYDDMNSDIDGVLEEETNLIRIGTLQHTFPENVVSIQLHHLEKDRTHQHG